MSENRNGVVFCLSGYVTLNFSMERGEWGIMVLVELVGSF